MSVVFLEVTGLPCLFRRKCLPSLHPASSGRSSRRAAAGVRGTSRSGVRPSARPQHLGGPHTTSNRCALKGIEENLVTCPASSRVLEVNLTVVATAGRLLPLPGLERGQPRSHQLLPSCHRWELNTEGDAHNPAVLL